MRYRLTRLSGLLLSAAATLSLTVAAAVAQSTSTPSINSIPDAVEEDWQLTIGIPDPIGVGPQITTCMSPVSDGSEAFVAFDMNYKEYPSFWPGGMQLQVWSKGSVIGTSSQGISLFNTAGETVTWTQRMSITGSTITYDIQNGQSVTWGQFGQGDRLIVSYPTKASDLSGYRPSVSAAASGVTWESNRVTNLTLVCVRYYANGQLFWTDNNPRVLVSTSSQ